MSPTNLKPTEVIRLALNLLGLVLLAVPIRAVSLACDPGGVTAAAMRSLSLAAPMLLATMLLGHSASAVSVTLGTGTGGQPSGFWNRASDGLAPDTEEWAYPAALPYSYISSVVDGVASSTAQYELSNSGFNITFEHSRGAAYLSSARTYGDVFFSVARDARYAVTGSYSAVDPEGRFLQIYVGLIEADNDPESLFYDYFLSESTPNESFTIGTGSGHGSPTGTLLAGQTYRFYFEATLLGSPSPVLTGATASGTLSFSIPEPSTGLLVIIGLLGLAGWRRAQA